MNQRNQPVAGQPQVIVVKQQSNGCLVTALVFVLFGWIGLAVMGTWKLTVLAWRWLVAYPVQWTWQATVALWRWSVQGSRWLTARYGWRGWAVVGAVVVVLTIISAVTGNH